MRNAGYALAMEGTEMEAPRLTLTIREDAEQIGGVPLDALNTITALVSAN